MSAFDLQHIFTPELHLGVSHTSDCPRWTSQSTPTPPTSQTPHFSAAQGHPMTSHCTNFHRFFPLSLVHFSGSQRGSFKKKNFVSKTTEKVPFFAAMLLLLGNNQLSSWVDFKHYFFKKKDQLSALTHGVLQPYNIMFKQQPLCRRNDPISAQLPTANEPSRTRDFTTGCIFHEKRKKNIKKWSKWLICF